jgi:DNA-binding NtrC family response regulator
MKHPWPGNIRELKNVVRRATLLAPGDLVDSGQITFIERAEDASAAGQFTASSLREAVTELEKKLIRQALDKSGGNKTRAAEALKMSYSSLLNKIKEYGFSD